MFRRDEKAQAARLARVLDGREPGEGELATLAAVLERAAEPVRFEVPRDDVDRALEAARPRLGAAARPARARVPRIGLAFGAAAAAAVAVLVVTLVRLPGVDVEAKALAALGGKTTVLHVTERIEPAAPGVFPVSTRSVWLDPAAGRVLSSQSVHGVPVEVTLVDEGRVSRFLPARNVLVVGSSCRAFASGCADIVDPIAFYRDALLAPGGIETKQEEVRGREVYRLTLPVQTLPDSVRIEQRVTIGAKTYLPKLIEWREHRAGEPARTVARIVIEDIRRMPREDAGNAFEFPIPFQARIVQRTAPGETLQTLGERRLPLAQARVLSPPLLWLGRRYEGRRLQEISEVRWNAGTAYRLRYRGLTVWNYSKVIPPELVAGRVGAPSKTLPGRRGIAHFYSTQDGRLVSELDLGPRSVAVVAPDLYKEDIFRVIEALRPLR